MTIAPFRSGHQVTLLENGAAFFPALIAAIDRAQVEFWLETYIFEVDEVGSAVIAALVRAAQRGVMVRLLVDGFGSLEFVRDHAERLRAAGVAVQVYRPLASGGRWWRPNRMRRLHRKLACRDGVEAFVGGINIVSDFRRQPEPNPRYPRWDFAVRLEGPVAAEVRAAMARLWRLVAWASRRGRVVVPRDPPFALAQAGPHRAALVLRDSFRHRHAIEQSYLNALATAQQEVWIVCAYFFPGRRFRRALEACAQRGVRVRLVLQGLSDHPILHYATRSLYPWLLENGIALYEYTRAMMHAKVAVVDDRYATVGSSNIDPFSLFLAREANAWVDDPALAEELRQRITQAVAEGAEALTLERVRRLPWYQRMASWVVLWGVRLAIGWAGIRREMEG
ncbi:cardiolipin synthase ClsB [Hydrogenophilus thermoluteolus]|nr:cardiolipin synthase ClsB [Hydrogenophilus thermoluteolus]MBW7656089.1 cardiolipin synthase ClsB [Hydrogenophilus thermoluteolus]